MLQATILILYLGAGSPVTAEFATHEACESAGRKTESIGHTFSSPRWICVPKGEPVLAVPQAR